MCVCVCVCVCVCDDDLICAVAQDTWNGRIRINPDVL